MILLINILVLAFCILLGFITPIVALIVSPILSLICCIIAWQSYVLTSSPEFIVSLAIFPATLGVALLSHGRDEYGILSGVWGITKFLLTLLGFVLLLVVLIAIFKPLGLILFAMLISSIIGYKLTSRYAMTNNIISTIGACMRQNLPLSTALETTAGENKDRQSGILRSISRRLSEGYSLSESIKLGYPSCPGDVVGMIAAAENVNQVPQAIKSLEADIMEKTDESKRVQPVGFSYPLIVLLIAFSIMIGLMVFIVPVFAEVLSDMSEGTGGFPKSTLFLMNITHALLRDNGIFLVVGLINLLIIASIIIYAKKRPRRPEEPYLLSRISDSFKWYLPFTRWFEMNYSLLRLTELMRTSLRAGVAVNEAIRNALKLDTNSCFRRRLEKWLERIERGEDISGSARQSGVGNAIAWAFDEKVNQGNTPEILEMLEEFYRSNYSYKVHLVRSVVAPLMVLGLGLTVGFVVYSMFIPMVSITNYMVNSITP
jgi:type IV pilus assembly protein PilC